MSDGERVTTLRGENIAAEFRTIIDDYVERKYPTAFMSQTLQAIRGMNDILPADAERWEAFEELVRDWLTAYGYRPIRMPLVEPTPLFARAIGDVTDIVEKEMYSFTDSLNGEQLTLRPEGTASCVRAVLQHNLLVRWPEAALVHGADVPPRASAEGPLPPVPPGRRRGARLAGPDIDAEQIIMCARLWDDLGLNGDGSIKLEINSLGQPEERAQHRTELIAYLEQHADQLDEEAKRRLHTNPLRILDTKNPAMQALVEGAPKLIDYLGEDSLKHFEGVQQLLKDAVIPYRINPRLVRGLDYYNLTVFEWVTEPARCAGHGLRRRPLRWSGRAARRQAGAGLRLRHGHRASDGTARGQGKVSSSRSRPTSMSCIRARPRSVWPSASPRCCATPVAPCRLHCGGGSFKSQIETCRCLRRANWRSSSATTRPRRTK